MWLRGMKQRAHFFQKKPWNLLSRAERRKKKEKSWKFTQHAFYMHSRLAKATPLNFPFHTHASFDANVAVCCDVNIFFPLLVFIRFKFLCYLSYLLLFFTSVVVWGMMRCLSLFPPSSCTRKDTREVRLSSVDVRSAKRDFSCVVSKRR